MKIFIVLVIFSSSFLTLYLEGHTFSGISDYIFYILENPIFIFINIFVIGGINYVYKFSKRVGQLNGK